MKEELSAVAPAPQCSSGPDVAASIQTDIDKRKRAAAKAALMKRAPARKAKKGESAIVLD